MKIYIYGLYKENFEYKTNKLDEGLFYIGITKNIKQRCIGHKNNKANPLKKAYMDKYGFIIKILYECNSYDEALERESFLIRWFGRIIDSSGILTNILVESEDIGKCNLGKKFSTNHRKNISDSCFNRPETYWNKQRDKRLILPLEQIHKILQEWEDSCPVNKNICKKYNIKNNVFNWWIRKYRPDLRNLIQKNQKQHINTMKNLGISQEKYAKIIGVCQTTISNWCIKPIKKPKIAVKDLDYKKQKYEEWTKSKLSKREFCKINNINYNSFKAWKNYYEQY